MLWVKSLYPSLPDSRQLSLRPQSVCQTKRAKVACTGCPFSKGEASFLPGPQGTMTLSQEATVPIKPSSMPPPCRSSALHLYPPWSTIKATGNSLLWAPQNPRRLTCPDSSTFLSTALSQTPPGPTVSQASSGAPQAGQHLLWGYC